MRRSLPTLFMTRTAVLLLVTYTVVQLGGRCFGQAKTDGSIILQTMDPSKAALPDVHLVLEDKSTNVIREARTQGSGSYVFDALPFGDYRLTVEHAGFQTTVYDSIIVQSGRDTTLNVILKVGGETQKIEVSAISVPVMETQSNTLATTVDLKQVLDLPLQGRNLLQLAFLTPGFAAKDGNGGGNGTFNGAPGAAFQANVDGVNATASRFKTSGGNGSSVQPRVESIQEFTVQSGELDPSQGGGQSAVQTLFVTNRGTNKFHGRIYEDHQNAGLNANTWTNNALHVRRPKFILNDFGFSVGGPIWKNRLFFFADYSESISPQSQTVQATVPTAAAMAGNYSYFTASGGIATINVLQEAQKAGFSSAVNPAVAAQIALNAKSYQYGSLSQSSTQLNTQTLAWALPGKVTNHYPSGRLDFALTPNVQLNLSGNYTKNSSINRFPAPYPGPDFAKLTTGSSGNSYVAAAGADWTIKPTILNQFRFGFLYNNSIFSPESAGYDVASQSNVNFNFGGVTSGIAAIVPQGSYYPYFTLSDAVSWQKGLHTIRFGGNAFREQDHFYNPPLGYTNITLGVVSLDPVSSPLINSVPTTGPNTPGNLSGTQGGVTGLYGMLNGRIQSAGRGHPLVPSTGQYGGVGTYNLDELLMGGGIYLQDSWRVRQDLTLNYGLRLDFIGDDHDLKNGYTGPSAAELFGPSGFGNIFKPGVLTGDPNPSFYTAGHKYGANLLLPQPQFGFAYNPAFSDNWFGKIFGLNKSVIRGSYTLKNYTEGGQNFWQAASDSGFNFFQNSTLAADNTGLTGHFAPGTLNLVGDNLANDAVLPPFALSPVIYDKNPLQSTQTFKGPSLQAINPHIKQPYLQSWTLGFQRQLSSSSAIELRYVGNHTVHDWLALNYNEVNTLENGFVNDFKAAQTNLAINAAAGIPNDFSNHGSGQAMPILNAAFSGSSAGNFKNASFITFLKNGSVGGLANAIVGNASFFCNLVGTAFSPCATVKGAPASSAFPINLFQANPFVTGRDAVYMDSVGSANYNALQLEFRQKITHGLELNANYTCAKTLGVSQQANIGSNLNVGLFTLHNLGMNYVPTAFDIRNTLHVSGTYDLPFGTNRRFSSGNRFVNYIAGGWTVGSIVVYQSGAPSLLIGGLASTVNPASDGGVNFVGGASAAQIQSSVRITHSPGNPYVNFLGSQYQGTTSANPAYAVPNTTPGVFGNLNYIYGPKWINTDIALTKEIPLRDRVHMNFQGEFLNAFNHPAFVLNQVPLTTSLNSSTFGTTNTLAHGPRHIELRANITF